MSACLFALRVHLCICVCSVCCACAVLILVIFAFVLCKYVSVHLFSGLVCLLVLIICTSVGECTYLKEKKMREKAIYICTFSIFSSCTAPD